MASLRVLSCVALVLVCVVRGVAPVAATSDRSAAHRFTSGEAGAFVEGELVVGWQDAAMRERLIEAGLELVHDDWSARLSRVRVAVGEEQTVAGRIARLPGVRWAERDAIVRAAALPNDPSFGEQWALQKIDAPRAWDFTTGSSQVVVAVIDSGVDLRHPEFEGRLVPGFNVRDPNTPPQDDYGHGTHVAGTIAAGWNNGIGVAGLAPESRIMPLKVLDSGGRGRASDVAIAIRWAVDNGARVINMSFGTEQRVRPLNEAVEYAVSRGTVMVVAVGNEGTSTPNFPAASPSVIAVGSTTMDDQRTYFSNHGSWVDIAAPGVGILSTAWGSTGSSYRTDTGTSMSAPLVSGVVALLFALQPDLTIKEIEAVLRLTADPVRDCGIGPGRLNAGKAVAAVANPESAPDVLRPRPSAARAPAALSYDTPAVSSRVFLPLVMREVNGWSTDVRLQNPGAASLNGTVHFHAEDGCLAGERPFTLLPYGSLSAGVEGDVFDPAAWRGSAVVTADGPISAMVAGHRPGADSFGYDGRTIGADVVYGPLLFKQRGGWTSTVHVQNLSDEPALVELRYTSTTGQPGIWDDRATVPARSSRTFRQESLPDGFAGAVVARSERGQPLALVVASLNSEGGATAYSGATQGSTALVAPVVFKQRSSNGRWDSGIQLQNVGALAAEVAIVYQSAGPEQLTVEQRARIGVGEAATFYQPDLGDLPTNFVGSATITVENGQPLLGLVNQVNYERGLSTTYELLGAGNPAGMAPLIVRASDGFDTGLQVQNLGSQPARVDVAYRNVGGALVALQSDEIPVGGSRTYYQPAIPGFPDRFTGTAIFSSTNGQPLAAVVNQVRY